MARKRLTALHRWAERSGARAQTSRSADEPVTAAPRQPPSGANGRDAPAPIEGPAVLGPDSPVQAAVARAKWLPGDPAPPTHGDSPVAQDARTGAAERWLID